MILNIFLLFKVQWGHQDNSFHSIQKCNKHENFQADSLNSDIAIKGYSTEGYRQGFKETEMFVTRR